MVSYWYLEGAGAGGNLLVIPIESLPFVVGRDATCGLTISSKDISRRHAQIQMGGPGILLVRDLGSTNGTFVNRQLISGPTHVGDGDVVHFGTCEFRLRMRRAELGMCDTVSSEDYTRIMPGGVSLPNCFPVKEREFLELLEQELVTAVFQPIVTFDERKVVAYEVLGRGRHPDLPVAPLPLFALAGSLQMETDLSEMFREAGVRAALSMEEPPRLFLNSHPKEMFSEALYRSLTLLRTTAPAIPMVLEVHESAITDLERMKILAERLEEMGIGLAYDDFGAGQARINELAEIPPDVVKFDMSLIRDLHAASPKKQQVVERLVTIVRGVGSVPLAEGVETEEEALVCTQMGFQLCQGYLTGRPTPVA